MNKVEILDIVFFVVKWSSNTGGPVLKLCTIKRVLNLCEYSVLASEAGDGEYGGHARILYLK